MTASDLKEKQLRILIEKKRIQWLNAEKRYDRYGSIRCLGQANKYREDYVDMLYIAYKNGYELSEREKQTVSLLKYRIV